jgi:hypothetical protein
MEITKLKTLFWKLKDQIKQTFGDFDDAALLAMEGQDHLITPMIKLSEFLPKASRLAIMKTTFNKIFF